MSHLNPNPTDILKCTTGVIGHHLGKSYLNLAKGQFHKIHGRKATLDDAQELRDLFEAQWLPYYTLEESERGTAEIRPRPTHRVRDLKGKKGKVVFQKNKLTTSKIRRELAILVESKKQYGMKPEEALNQSRQEINNKYGRDWRTKYETQSQSYDDWWGECNMDGSFAYNGCTEDF